MHCTQKTTAQINLAGGAYIMQVKENQEVLRKQLQKRPDETLPIDTQLATDKGHGRLEKRCATFFSLSDLKFHKRWNKSNFQTLIVMNRETFEKAKQKTTQKTSYYITNQVIKKSYSDAHKELFDAVREHWGVESDNSIRDVTFNEDNVKTKSHNLARVLATFRTLTIGLFRKADIKNFKEGCENFTDSQSLFEAFLQKLGFL